MQLDYGFGDTSFHAAGGEAGIWKLVDEFYDYMETLPLARKILLMHPEDLQISRDKLFRFLCGWLGGPRLFQQKYGPISIPGVHAHLTIGIKERDAWLICMKKSIEQQDYESDFKEYLFNQLCFPAERVRNAE
ncbi:group II truncated hemoglobin [Aliikangiella maris]|uniref:Group II truncated hemoglobin n=2 Tax=Aliikangiella maris TaxID=3162458 RepID=A0ABV2BVR3_9GAMM